MSERERRGRGENLAVDEIFFLRTESSTTSASAVSRCVARSFTESINPFSNSSMLPLLALFPDSDPHAPSTSPTGECLWFLDDRVGDVPFVPTLGESDLPIQPPGTFFPTPLLEPEFGVAAAPLSRLRRLPISPFCSAPVIMCKVPTPFDSSSDLGGGGGGEIAGPCDVECQRVEPTAFAVCAVKCDGTSADVECWRIKPTAFAVGTVKCDGISVSSKLIESRDRPLEGEGVVTSSLLP